MDIVIRQATIIDGTGKDGFDADIAIQNGRIAAIGDITQSGREEIDARGLIATPGFVDIHTHYDGQASWEHRLPHLRCMASPPSSWAIAASASRRAGRCA